MATGTTPKGYVTVDGADPVLNGDNVITTLAGQIDTHLGRMACGQVAIPVGGTTTGNTAAVTYPAGRFTATPRVMVTAAATATVENPTMVSVLTPSVTGVTISMSRASGGTNVTVYWLAVQN